MLEPTLWRAIMHHPVVPIAPKPPVLTVCVPTYDRPQLVQRALASIIGAASGTIDQIEIIVSDNSPSVSEQACRAGLAAWPGRSTYLGNQQNIGIAENLNQCIAHASGQYLLFVHDDDVLLPGAVGTILEALRRPQGDASVLMLGVHLVDVTGHVLHRQEFCRDQRITAPDALERLLSDNGIAWFPGLVVRADAYAAAGPFDSVVGNATDLDMWVRLFGRFGIQCVPGAVSGYTVHAGSATQAMGVDRTALGSLTAIFARARQTGVLPEQVVERCQAQFIHQVILGAAYAALRGGHRATARRVLGTFGDPAIRGLRTPLEWLPARWITALVVGLPFAISQPLVALVDRLDLVRRIRAFGVRGRGSMPFC
ncbi:MAG: glycosyltransferase family 2 protein [Chloroflexota bacterium]